MTALADVDGVPASHACQIQRDLMHTSCDICMPLAMISDHALTPCLTHLLALWYQKLNGSFISQPTEGEARRRLSASPRGQ